jgi:hypothetical protein
VKLPWTFVKRLKEIEERILEFEVWKELDPLYLLIDEELQHSKSMEFTSRSKNHSPLCLIVVH